MKKVVTLILVLTFVFSPIFARPAQAQWIDISTAAKDYGLDALAWEIINRVISRISASTVKWINSGFKGKPAYVTDPTQYFGDIGNGVAGEFIMRNPNLNFLCGPINARIKLALSRTYNSSYEDRRWRCTLDDAVGNMTDFMNDFEKGGWDKFFRLTQERQNNPIGAYLQAEGDLFNQIATKVSEKDKELGWGGGFMSAKECVETAPPFDMPIYGPNGNVITTVLQEGHCLKERTTTPGETISSQLNKTLGIGNERLAVGDELNEIISALLNQILGSILGGGGGGLRGTSQPNATNNNQVLTNQLQNEATTTDYFGNQQNTDVLDVPLPTTVDTLPPGTIITTPYVPPATNITPTPTTPTVGL